MRMLVGGGAVSLHIWPGCGHLGVEGRVLDECGDTNPHVRTDLTLRHVEILVISSDVGSDCLHDLVDDVLLMRATAGCPDAVDVRHVVATEPACCHGYAPSVTNRCTAFQRAYEGRQMKQQEEQQGQEQQAHTQE